MSRKIKLKYGISSNKQKLFEAVYEELESQVWHWNISISFSLIFCIHWKTIYKNICSVSTGIATLTWIWGHDASKVGSSSSGSNSAPAGFEDGGRARNVLTANCKNKQSE